jgi:hypothetical protein
MAQALSEHTARLRLAGAAMVASLAVYGAVALLVPPSPALSGAQGSTLLGVLVLVTALNLVTLKPVYRAMLTGPLRVYAAGRSSGPLLAAHLVATVVAMARVEAVAVLGLLLYLVTGQRDWFWGFTGVAALGLLWIWPSAQRIRDDLGFAGDSEP